MSSITISLDACIEDMEKVVLFLNGLIEKQKLEEEEWKNKRTKKKTVQEVLEEIKEDIEINTNDINNAKVEIENLELKRTELLKVPNTEVKVPLKIRKPKKKTVTIVNPNEILLVDN